MKEIEVADYFDFGGPVEYLRQAERGEPFFGDIYIQTHINRILEFIVELDMYVTSRSRAFLEMKNFQNEIEKKEESYLLTEEDCIRFCKIIDRLLEIIEAEISGNHQSFKM